MMPRLESLVNADVESLNFTIPNDISSNGGRTSPNNDIVVDGDAFGPKRPVSLRLGLFVVL